MKDEMREEGLNEEDAKRCVNFRREMYGFCNYDNAFTGKEEREVMTPVLVLFRPVKKTRQGKVGENESESDSDSDSDEDHKEFNEEECLRSCVQNTETNKAVGSQSKNFLGWRYNPNL